MKATYRLELLVLAGLAIGVGFQASDPNAAIKEIQEYRTQKLNELRSSGQPLTAAAVNAISKDVLEKAKAKVKGVDPAKIDPKQGFDWATLFSMAEMHKEACDSATRYLETKPDAAQRFAAQSLMMRSCNALGEAHMLVMMIGELAPPTPNDALGLASMTANLYADTIHGKMGAEAAIRAIEKVEALLPAPAALDEKTRPRLNSSIAMLAQAKSEYLTQSGKTDEAMAALDKALALLPEGDPSIRSLKAGKTRMAMMGKPAPVITVERFHGDFKGMDSYKGKVVILDFFAHWCGPCIASFPDMKKMYADLKDSGLEVLHVTTYYGYYKGENSQKRDMPRDTEFGKMAEFIAEHQLPWPVVYGERTNFEAYGITGIPHVAVVDRQGNIQKIKIGYSAKEFPKFREEIEKLLSQK